MERIKSNKIIKKVIILILFIMAFNFVAPIKVVEAKKPKTSILTSPIRSLIVNTTATIDRVFTVIMSGDDGVSSIEDMEDEQKAEDLDKRLLSPEDIFRGDANKVPISSVNIFEAPSSGGGNGPKQLVAKVKEAVKDLYLFFRNLAAIVMLTALIYVGIMIILNTTNPQAQSEWKQVILQWLKGLILVMFIHVLMISVMYFSKIITETLNKQINGDQTILQTIYDDIENSENSKGDKLIAALLFAFASYAMWVFGVAYLKRFMYMMVLIVIAPIFGALYGMGKFGHERFKHWFREFIAGVMVQPFHLLIFAILLEMPLKLVSGGGTNLYTKLYAILSILMIRPIEKFVRALFGFSNTAMDNVSSFESGKKTLEAGLNTAVKVGGAALTVGSAIATGGASLASGLLGKTGGAGGEGEIPLNDVAGALSTEDDPDAVGDIDAQTRDVERNNYLRNGFDTSTDGYVEESQDPDNYISPDPFHDGYSDAYLGNGQEENDKRAAMNAAEMKDWLDNMGLEGQEREEIAQLLGKDQLATLSDEDIEIELDNMGLEGKEREEMAEVLRQSTLPKETTGETKEIPDEIEIKDAPEDADDDKGEDKTYDGGPAHLTGGTLEANTVNVIGDNVKVGDGNGDKEEAQLDLKDVDALLDKELGEDKDKGAFEKMKDGFNAAKDSTLGRVIQDTHNALHSADARKKYSESWESMRGFTESLYAQGGSGDSGLTAKLYTDISDKRKESFDNKFINNQGNIQAVIKERNLQDKHDKAGNVIKSKEDQAKEFLQNATPYVERGITDIKVISDLMDISGTKGKDKGQAMRQYIMDQMKGIHDARGSRATARAEKENLATFNSNVQNTQTITNSVRQQMLAQGRNINSAEVRREIQQAVQAELFKGNAYIAAGIAKDATRMLDLNRLGDEIARRIKMSSPADTAKTTMKFDKIIEEAIKKGSKEIKLSAPQGVSSKTTIEIEKMLNNELQRRMSAGGNSKTTQTTTTTTKTTTTSKTSSDGPKTVESGKADTKGPKDSSPKPQLNSGDSGNSGSDKK